MVQEKVLYLISSVDNTLLIYGDILIGEKYVTGFTPHQVAQRGLFRTFQVAHEYPRMTLMDNLKIAPINQKGESLFKNLFSSKKIKEEDEI